MQEYGSVKIFCVSKRDCFTDVIGQNLLSINAVVTQEDRKVIGIQMLFSENTKLSILNLGDELFVFNNIPEKLISEENLTFSLVA